MATRIAVVDDDDSFRKKIRNAIATMCKERHFDVVIEDFINGRRLTGMIDDRKTFDVYFLDIKMNDYMSGVQVAEYIRRKDEWAIIVFLTSYEEYAIQGYSYQAFEYIMKQNWERRLPEVISRIQKKVEKRKEKRYLIESETKWEAVYFEDVLYIEKQGKNVIFHCSDEKTYQQRAPLKQVYDKMPQDDFIYINRGQIVNMKYVVFMGNRYIRLRDKTELDISRYMMDEVRQQILKMGRSL